MSTISKQVSLRGTENRFVYWKQFCPKISSFEKYLSPSDYRTWSYVDYQQQNKWLRSNYILTLVLIVSYSGSSQIKRDGQRLFRTIINYAVSLNNFKEVAGLLFLNNKLWANTKEKITNFDFEKAWLEWKGNASIFYAFLMTWAGVRNAKAPETKSFSYFPQPIFLHIFQRVRLKSTQKLARYFFKKASWIVIGL